MDEQNNDINRLDTVLGVQEDKSAGSKIKNFLKKFKDIPEKREVPIRYRADFRKTNKDLDKQLKTWEKFGKKQAGNPLLNYFFGNKHKAIATKRLFADLEKTARKSVQKYNNILNDGLGADREKNKGKGFDYGGEIGDVRDAHSSNIQSRVEKQERLNALTEEYNNLLAKQSKRGLLDKEASIIGEMENVRNKLSDLETERNDTINSTFDSVQPMKIIKTKSRIIAGRNKELAKLAAGLYDRTGDESLFRTLKLELDDTMKTDEAALTEVVTKLKSVNGKKGALTRKLNKLKQEPQTEEVKSKINELNSDLAKTELEIKKLTRDKKIAEGYVKLDKKQQGQYQHYYDNRDNPSDFGRNRDYRTDEFAPKFDAMARKKATATDSMVNKIGALTTPTTLTKLNNSIDAAYNKLGKLQTKLQEVTSKKADITVDLSEDDTEENITKQITEKKKAIDNVNNVLKKEKAEGKELLNIFHKLKLEMKNASKELRLLKADMQIDPIEVNLESSDLKKYNDLAEDIKHNVAGIGRNWKKSNVFTRLASRILLNIRSQIADMINPLTLFRRGWEDWINRFDNLPWKNTFDVIAYNLVTAFAPVFEWMAKALIKVAQVANVFIKRWTGVDLFDKSAWQLEQIKKGLGQLTAGFDELHATNDNPNQFNTIFDTDPMAITPLSEELTKKLEKWADRIAKAFKWIKDNWLLLVGLWAAFKLGKGLLSLLGWIGRVKLGLQGLTSGFKALNLVNLGKLAGWLSVILGSVLLIKSAFDRWEWNKEFFGVNPDERQENGDKITKQTEIGGAMIGGGLGAMFGVSGLALAGPQGLIIGALMGDGIAESISGAVEMALNLNKGDSKGVVHSAEKFGEGLGKTAGTALGAKLGMSVGAKIGGALGTALAPGVGTAIGVFVGSIVGAVGGWFAGGKVGKALGNLSGQLANAVQSMIRGSGAFQKLKVNANDVEQAMQNVSDKTNIYNEELSKLQYMEQVTGINAKELYDAVQQGNLVYSDLSYTQKTVYDQYANMLTAEENLKTAKLQNMEVSAKWEEQLARESGNYNEYIKTLQKGVEDGIISQDQMVDYFAQTYGKIDADAKKVFLEQLPSHLRESVVLQGAEYETLGNKIATGWDNIKTSISNKITEIKTSIAEGWENIKTNIATTWDNIKTTAGTAWENIKTTVGNVWESMKTLGGNIWRSIRIEAHESWEEMKATASTVWENIKTTASTAWENIKNSAIGQKVQEIVENAKVGWENLKIKAGETWENVKTAASTAWDNIKNSAIGQKVQEIVENTKIGWENLKTNTVEAWENIKTKTAETWENLKTKASETWENIKTTTKESWENIKTKTSEVWENMKTKASETWENIKTKAADTWENIKESAIGQKVQEIWKNTTEKFEEIKTKVSDGWNTLKTNAKEKWNDIKNSIVTAAKTAWDNAKGFFDKIGEGVKKAWEGIKGLASRTGERIGNFFGGKGFKTDEEYDEYVKKYGVPQYAVGTNYVPNDQLAMVHKGEAIIPAKYNKPYTPPSGNSELESTIASMTQEIANLRSLIQGGIPVKGEFKQRGSDLVAVVEKGRYRNGNSTLSNPAYAR